MPSPDRNYLAFARKGITSTTLLPQGPQASLSSQLMSLRESLGRPNQRSSETYQASYGHRRCNLNLVRLFLLALPFLFPYPCGHKPATSFAYAAVPSSRVKCCGTPVPRDAQHPMILGHAVRPLFLLPSRPTSSHVLHLSRLSHMSIVMAKHNVILPQIIPALSPHLPLHSSYLPAGAGPNIEEVKRG